MSPSLATGLISDYFTLESIFPWLWLTYLPIYRLLFVRCRKEPDAILTLIKSRVGFVFATQLGFALAIAFFESRPEAHYWGNDFQGRLSVALPAASQLFLVIQNGFLLRRELEIRTRTHQTTESNAPRIFGTWEDWPTSEKGAFSVATVYLLPCVAFVAAVNYVHPERPGCEYVGPIFCMAAIFLASAALLYRVAAQNCLAAGADLNFWKYLIYWTPAGLAVGATFLWLTAPEFL